MTRLEDIPVMDDGIRQRDLDMKRWDDDARAIRSTLRHAGQGDSVRMRCFNEEDRDEIARRLSPEDRERVQFTWLTFGVEP